VLWMVFIRRKNGMKFRWDLQESRRLLITALPLGIAMIISQVVLQFPAIYLGIVDTASEVGIYSAAFKLTVVILIFDRVFYAIFFPTISYYFQNRRDKLDFVFKNVLKFVTALALFVGLCAILSADMLIKSIYSTNFVEAVPVFQLMVGYFIFTLISSVFAFTLIGMKLEKIYTRSLIAGMLVFFAGILVLGNVFGAAGAAGSIVFYILVSLIIMIAGLKPHISMDLVRTLVLPIAATLLIFLPILEYIHLPLVIKLVIAAGICLPAISWLCGIGINEINYLKRVLIWN
jgi:O-antigen/teichoic acid export membrane protein